MKIESLKDLRQVVKLCRDNGVSAIEIDGIKMEVSLASKPPKKHRDLALDIPEANIKVPAYNGPTTPEIHTDFDELTEEQKLFYSATPEPGSVEAQ